MDDLISERWLPVMDYEGLYEVSNFGRVRSLRHRWGLRPGPKLLKPQTHPSGHLHVNLYGHSRPGIPGKIHRKIHHLVLEAFDRPRPAGLEGCHNDGDPANNRLTNLRWDTRAANIQDALRHGTHWAASKTHCVNGHEFTEENTYNRPGERHRECRECMKASGAVQTAKVTAARTHCNRGHEYTPENTKITSHGMRRCVACDELGLRRPRLQTCQRGHEMAGENIYVTPDGRRQCRKCRDLRSAAAREKRTVARKAV